MLQPIRADADAGMGKTEGGESEWIFSANFSELVQEIGNFLLDVSAPYYYYIQMMFHALNDWN